MVADEYYKKYLDGRLELLFNDNGDNAFDNFLLKKTKSRLNNMPTKRYSNPEPISLSEVLNEYSDIDQNDISPLRPQAVKLENGVVGVRLKNGWYFPKLKLITNCKDDNIRYFDNGYFSLGNSLYDNNMQLVNRESIFKQGYSGCYDLYSDKFFLYEVSDFYKKLIDMEGNEFIIGNPNDKVEIKDQCILIRMPDYYYYGKTEKRYKVLLKDGTPFCEGKTFSIICEQYGYLIIAEKLERYNSPVCVILPNGKPLDNGNTFQKCTISNKYIAGHKKDSIVLFDNNGNKNVDMDFAYIDLIEPNSTRKCIGLDRKQYILFDKSGTLFSKIGYDKINLIDEKYAVVKENNDYFIVDKNGNKIHSNGNKPYNYICRYNNIFVEGENKLIVNQNERLKEANVRKSIFGYTYNEGNETVHLKYQPVMLYGDKQVLCVSNKKEFYMYNVSTKSYTKLGYITNIHYNESLIEVNDKVLFPYQEQLIDITDFYKERLSKLETIRFNSDIGKIQTKEEYVKENEGTLKLLQLKSDLENERLEEEKIEARKSMQEKLAKEAEERKKLLDKQREARLLRETAEKKRQEENRTKELKEKYLKQMKELHTNLRKLDETIEIPKVPVSDLLIDYGDHYEIDPAYEDYLDTIDLSGETFEKVKVSGGLHFEGSNARFDPQVVYKRDMSGSDFTGVYFPPFTNFTEVNLNGSTLSYDHDRSTIDMFNSSIENAFYDENTRINGKTVEEFFKEEGRQLKHNL